MDENPPVKGCPGAQDIRRPRPEYFACPGCGEEIEVWTDEIEGVCDSCGMKVPKEGSPSCIEWCEHARECVGAEKYDRLMQGRRV